MSMSLTVWVVDSKVNAEMSMSLTVWVAIGFGALLAIWGLPARQTRFWLNWGKFVAILYLLGYFVMGALAGLLGYGIAKLLHWKPTDSEWINGLIFAAAGHAVVRANGAQFNASEMKEAGSVFGLGTRWFENQLNELAEARILRWLERQDEAQVARVARRVLGGILGRYSLAEAQQTLSAENSRSAHLLSARIQDLANESDATQREIMLNGLIEFCKEEFCARWLLRRSP